MVGPMPAHVEPDRAACRVKLGADGVATVSDDGATASYSGMATSRRHETRRARMRRQVARRSWRCPECGSLTRSDTRARILARGKRKAPYGHWIVDYEKTARLRCAETATRKIECTIRNRRKDAAHNATATIVRTYGLITVNAEPDRLGMAREFERQLGYKSAWPGRKLKGDRTAAQAETSFPQRGRTDVETVRGR